VQEILETLTALGQISQSEQPLCDLARARFSLSSALRFAARGPAAQGIFLSPLYGTTSQAFTLPLRGIAAA
jgi:hypothetical protein